MSDARNIIIINNLKTQPGIDHAQIDPFAKYMLDSGLQVGESLLPSWDIDAESYKVENFKADNQLVLAWFTKLQQQFNEWSGSLSY